MSYRNLIESRWISYALRAAVIGGFSVLAACGSPPPQTISTTTEQTTSTPPGTTLSPSGDLQPGIPGTTTTTTTHSVSQPQQ